MQWYYSSNGQEKVGPLSDAEFQALVQTGAVTGQTVVWRQGMPAWAPYSQVNFDAPAPVASSALTEGSCAECGRKFPQTEMVQFETSSVCAACKPVFFQKLREGVLTAPASGLWRSGRNLVCSVNARLPQRCIKCNAPTETKQIKRTLYWHSPFVYLVILLNLLIYLIVAIVVRKRAMVFVSICPEHRQARRNVILTSWALVLGGIAGAIAGGVMQSGWLAAAGGVLFLLGIGFGIVRGRLVSPRKIEKEFVWISGCGPEFLAGLPSWNKS
jgi:hypothetical protein